MFQYDSGFLIFSIQSYGGGSDARNFCFILHNMYINWLINNKKNFSIIEKNEVENEQLSSSMIKIKNDNVSNLLLEVGMHRLVRISPYDKQKRRHTSFCNVNLWKEQDVIVQILPSDIKIECFRSSGKGGQHVNKTESAVRITHIATGITASCQSGRNQIKNKEEAMENLKNKLFVHYSDLKKKETNLNTIRSYVFDPITYIKDENKGLKFNEVKDILSGNLNIIWK